MQPTHIINAVSINMMTAETRQRQNGGAIEYQLVSLDTARKIAQAGLVPAFGHEQSAPAVQAELGLTTSVYGRPTLRFDAPASVLLAQYVGLRLAEGETKLPDQSEFEYYIVKFT